MLDDREGAVEDYEKSLSIEPDGKESLERLCALYEEAMDERPAADGDEPPKLPCRCESARSGWWSSTRSESI
jgi:hypothetical protein